VPEQFLDGPEIRTAFEQMSGEGVPKSMWTNSMRASNLSYTTTEDIPDAPIGQSTPFGVYKERLSSGIRTGTRWQVGADRLGSTLTERDNTFFTAFTQYSDCASFEIHLRQVQPD